MSCRTNLKLLPLMIVIVVLCAGDISAQSPSLIVSVEDVAVPAGQTTGYVSIYLDNLTDTIVAFQLWLQLSNPEIIQFTSVIDTAGTLISGWGHSASSLSGTYYDIKIIAGTGPPYLLAISPQQGGTLLRLPVTVHSIPDTATFRSVDILVEQNMLDHFNFSDPWGNSIGVITDSIPDTTWYVCNTWEGEVCLDSTQVAEGESFDFIAVQWQLFGYLDTNAVEINDGSFTIAEPSLCGDMDDSGNIDVADLTYFVAYLFTGGPAPPNLWTADCTGDGNIDVTDLTCYVCYLFLGCPPPICL